MDDESDEEDDDDDDDDEDGPPVDPSWVDTGTGTGLDPSPTLPLTGPEIPTVIRIYSNL